MKTSLLLIFTILTGFAVNAHSAVVMFDAAKTGDFQGDGSTTEFNLGSFTVGDYTNTFLAFAAGGGEIGTPTISSVTFNDISLSAEVQATRNNGNWNAEIWVLDQELGNVTGDLVVTLDSPGTDPVDGTPEGFYYALTSFYNVDGLVDSDSGDGTDPIALNYDLGSDPFDVTYLEVGTDNGSNVPGGVSGSTLIHSGDSLGSWGAAIYRDTVTGQSGSVTRNFDLNHSNANAAGGIALTPIPEPSAGTLIMLTGGLLVLLRRRKNFFI